LPVNKQPGLEALSLPTFTLSGNGWFIGSEGGRKLNPGLEL